MARSRSLALCPGSRRAAYLNLPDDSMCAPNRKTLSGASRDGAHANVTPMRLRSGSVALILSSSSHSIQQVERFAGDIQKTRGVLSSRCFKPPPGTHVADSCSGATGTVRRERNVVRAFPRGAASAAPTRALRQPPSTRNAVDGPPGSQSQSGGAGSFRSVPSHGIDRSDVIATTRNTVPGLHVTVHGLRHRSRPEHGPWRSGAAAGAVFDG